jgi:hypothetical protein
MIYMIDGTDLRLLAPVRTGMIYIQTMKSVVHDDGGLACYRLLFTPQI